MTNACSPQVMNSPAKVPIQSPVEADRSIGALSWQAARERTGIMSSMNDFSRFYKDLWISISPPTSCIHLPLIRKLPSSVVGLKKTCILICCDEVLQNQFKTAHPGSQAYLRDWPSVTRAHNWNLTWRTRSSIGKGAHDKDNYIGAQL